MRILFTGGSSFTGFWFARELAKAGHEVVTTFRQRPDEYPDEIRRSRVKELTAVCRPMFGAAFGDDLFMDLVGEGRWDVVCHHAANVNNYKSPDFDCVGAVAANTRNVAAVTQGLKARGCDRLVCTGSVFENDEGVGSEGLPAFSPYGLSKSLSWQLFRYYGLRAGLAVGKFVIPNPFGPWEEPRFTAYLMKNWIAGKAAVVNTPDYVRDNIHVSLLARSYRRFVETLPTSPGLSRLNPSGYAESQGAFALRVAAQVRKRADLACDVDLGVQKDFAEPRIRINTDAAVALVDQWDEAAAWDEMVAFYLRRSPAERAANRSTL